MSKAIPFDAQAWLTRWTDAGGSFGCASGKPMLFGVEFPHDPVGKFRRLGELHAELGEADRQAVRDAICAPIMREAIDE